MFKTSVIIVIESFTGYKAEKQLNKTAQIPVIHR